MAKRRRVAKKKKTLSSSRWAVAVAIIGGLSAVLALYMKPGRSPAGFKPAEFVRVSSAEDPVTIEVGSEGEVSYQLLISRKPFGLRLVSEGLTRLSLPVVQAQVPHPDEAKAIKARAEFSKKFPGKEPPAIPEKWVGAKTELADFHLEGTSLSLDVSTDEPGISYRLELALGRDRVQTAFDTLSEREDLRQTQLCHDVKTTGHWYGHGEVEHRNQPWPLEQGSFTEREFGPANYKQIEPFWFSSRSAGLLYDGSHPIEVRLNEKKSGLLCLGTNGVKHMVTTYVLARTPAEVFGKYIRVARPVRKSQAPARHFELPVWNSWAQFYSSVNQADLLAYARDLKQNGLRGHAIQLDDKWESDYGNLTFDKKKFPDPRALSDSIHEMGFAFGVWTTLWMNTDSTGFKTAKALGYLLKDRKLPTEPCIVEWWNGKAGIVDLANPAARAWYQGQLEQLRSEYRIDGFKFDTRFYDPSCLPYPGSTGEDYLGLGAELASGYDLQGVGVRISWKSQKYGFITRQLDKHTNWSGLRTAVRQNLAISTVGYPYVASDMIGGSLGDPPPVKKVLIRWAQAAALMPVMYSSTSPLGVKNPWAKTGQKYDPQTVSLYRDAIELHSRLAPYILRHVRRAEGTSEPIMRPLFFDFPKDAANYTIDDQWMLGDLVLAAPILGPKDFRRIHFPEGVWWDVLRRRTIQGPATIARYRAAISETPLFVLMDDREAPGMSDLQFLGF